MAIASAAEPGEAGRHHPAQRRSRARRSRAKRVATIRPSGDRHIVNNLRCQENSWRAWFAEEDITPIDITCRVLWRNLTATVATVLEALGLDAEAAPMMQRQANNRADEWVERYRREAPLLGLAS
ncbi:hypothetical protein B8W69_27510 [Mycobacterium vulneris]|uniref:Sulphotransferase Stf0 domain-containing protein n=1 Tax=Mycolicibacterium vulneris TaxID=547163 RepID=A0A1X2KJF5_9MYCO|nr:hypothetical protein B8W69_27510 [Mycolicibacterium vulneris]